MNRRDFLKGMLVLPASIVAYDFLKSIETVGFNFGADIAYASEIGMLDKKLVNMHENPPNQKVEPFWEMPRRLKLERTASGEYFDAVYWENGKLNVDGYTKLCWLLRDVRYKKAAWIDPRVLDILLAIQAWVAAYGYTKPIKITSGYRTPQNNAQLEGAAKNSQHLLGKAIDFVVPDLPSNYIGLLARHYQGGGVGFYPSSKFTHIDSGRVRTWVGK